MLIKRLDLPFSDCEVKFRKGDEGTFEGYGSKFGLVDSYGDTIIKGAYKDTLKDRKRLPDMYFNHNSYSELPPGLWKGMSEDSTGLFVKGELTNNSLGRDVMASMKHGTLTGLSIGYTVKEQKVLDDGDRRELIKINLIEVSVVTRPADDEARITGVKSEIESLNSIRDFEHFLRDSGITKDLAVTFVSRIKSVYRSDSDAAYIDEIAELKAQLAGFVNVKGSTDSVRNLNESLRRRIES